jgi:hypothetical protein
MLTVISVPDDPKAEMANGKVTGADASSLEVADPNIGVGADKTELHAPRGTSEVVVASSVVVVASSVVVVASSVVVVTSSIVVVVVSIFELVNASEVVVLKSEVTSVVLSISEVLTSELVANASVVVVVSVFVSVSVSVTKEVLRDWTTVLDSVTGSTATELLRESADVALLISSAEANDVVSSTGIEVSLDAVSRDEMKVGKTDISVLNSEVGGMESDTGKVKVAVGSAGESEVIKETLDDCVGGTGIFMVVADVFEKRNVAVNIGCVCGASVEKGGMGSDGNTMEDESTGNVTSEGKADLVCDIKVWRLGAKDVSTDRIGSPIVEVGGLIAVLLTVPCCSRHS